MLPRDKAVMRPMSLVGELVDLGVLHYKAKEKPMNEIDRACDATEAALLARAERAEAELLDARGWIAALIEHAGSLGSTLTTEDLAPRAAAYQAAMELAKHHIRGASSAMPLEMWQLVRDTLADRFRAALALAEGKGEKHDA